MKYNRLVIITSLFLFSGLGFTKPVTVVSLNKEIVKLTKENNKQESKIFDLVSKSKQNVSKSKLLKDEGDLLIELGKKGQMKSLSKYRYLVSQMGQAQSSKVLNQELKYLKELQSSWEGYDKKVEDGEDSIEKSTKLNIKVIKANDEASKVMEKFEKTKSKLNELIEQKNQLENPTSLDVN